MGVVPVKGGEQDILMSGHPVSSMRRDLILGVTDRLWERDRVGRYPTVSLSHVVTERLWIGRLKRINR